jgi:hypothetical protein
MPSNDSTAAVLVFEDVEFDVVDLHGVPWLRSFQIGSALGYQNPSSDMAKLFDRNADEFTDEMTRVVELQTAGGKQQVRIFSPRGSYLLGMLARTERAKTFRRWVLDVLEGRALPHETGRMTIPQQISTHRLRIALLKELKAETAPGMRRALHDQVCHVSRLLNLPSPLLNSIGQDDPQHPLPGV